MTAARNISGTGFVVRKETARKTTRTFATEQEAVAALSASDRANYINRNMDRVAPKTHAKLDAYQAEGHGDVARESFKGLTAKEIRERILGS